MNKYTKSKVQAISEKDRSIYTTPSGAIIEELQKVAKEKDIASYANICLHYAEIRPEAAQFIAGRTPGVICNNYFVGLNDFDYEKYIIWSLDNPEWGKPLAAAYSSAADLEKAVDGIISAVSNYTA